MGIGKRFVGIGVVVGAVFVVVGMATAWGVVRHAGNVGSAEPEIRLAGAMAGLFAGGAAALLVGLALTLSGRKG